MENRNTNSFQHLSVLLTGVIKQIEVADLTKSATPCTALAPKSESQSTQVTFPVYRRNSRPLRMTSPMGIDDQHERELKRDAMNEFELSCWLTVLNDELRECNMETIPNSMKAVLIGQFVKENYTFDMAEAASKFIVSGKKSNFIVKGKVLPEYFYPTKEDMAQFSHLFVTSETMKARLDEQKRELDREKSSLLHEVAQKQTLCDQLRKDLAQAKREPLTKFEITQEEREQLDLVKQVANAWRGKSDAEMKLKKVEKQLVEAERRIAELELEAEAEVEEAEWEMTEKLALPPPHSKMTEQ